MKKSEKIVNTFLYSSIFVAFISSLLSVIPLIFQNKDILLYKICLIFSGTLFVYNYDHLQDIKYDRKTNPQRTRFILENKLLLKIITIVSGMLSGYLFLTYNPYENLILVPALLFGLLHWKFKVRRYLSAVYITLSWLLVVVIYPSGITFEFDPANFLIASVFGLTFLANSVVFMTDEIGKDKKEFSILISKIALIMAILLSILSPGSFKSLFFIPVMTLLAVARYPRDETLKLLYLDGALLLGGCLSLLTHQLAIRQFHWF